MAILNRVKNKIGTINCGECNSVERSTAECNSIESKYGKNFTKIKFETDDDLPLNKPLNLHILTIIVRSVFEGEDKFYPQVYLDECLCQLRV